MRSPHCELPFRVLERKCVRFVLQNLETDDNLTEMWFFQCTATFVFGFELIFPYLLDETQLIKLQAFQMRRLLYVTEAFVKPFPGLPWEL